MKIKKNPRHVKRSRWILPFAFSLLLAACLFFFPNFVSSEHGKEVILYIINKKISGKLQAKKLSFSWFQPQSMTEIIWVDEKNQTLFTCEKLTTTASFWTLIFSNHFIADTKLFSPSLQITADLSPSIITPLRPKQQASFFPKIASSPKKFSFFGDIEVIDGKIAIFASKAKDKKISIANFESLNAQINLPKEGSPIHFALLGQTLQDQIQGNFSVKAELNSLEFFKPNLDIQAKLNSFPVKGIDELFTFFNPELKGLILDAIGPSIDLDLDAKFQENRNEVKLIAQSSLLTAEIQTQSIEKTLKLKAPAALTFTATSNLLEKLSHYFPNINFPHLEHPQEIQLNISELNLPFSKKGLDYSSFSFEAALNLSNAELSFLNENRSVYIQSMQINASSAHLFDELFISATSKLTESANPGELLFQGNFKNLLKKSPEINAKVKMHQFPLMAYLFKKLENTYFILSDAELSLDIQEKQMRLNAELPHLKIPEMSFILKEQMILTNPVSIVINPLNEPFLFTSPVTLEVNSFSMNKDFDMEFELSAHSSQLNLSNASFTLSNEGLKLKSPIEINYIVNEPFFQSLANDPLLNNLTLDEESHWSFSVKKFSILSITKPLDFSNLIFVGSAHTESLTLKEKNNNEALVQLKKIFLKVNKEHFTLPFEIEFSGNALSNLSKEGKWDINMSLSNTQLTDGFLELKIHAQKIPTALLDAFYPFFEEKPWSFTKILGQTLNANIHLQLREFNGFLQMNFQSSKALLSCSGKIQHGQLNLNEPIHSQILITKDFSKLLLKAVNPFSISSAESNHPLTLYIDHKVFSFPLFPFDKESINIGSGRIDLGQIQCINEGTFNLTLGLLKQNFLKNSSLNLWFTPIDWHIQNATVHVERTEILIDQSFEICLWGKINLINNSVDMVLGLTSQCLKKAFGIKELPPNYVLQIPIKGSIDNVQLDVQKATAKITTLLLWQKGMTAGALKGPFGSLVEGFVGKLATLPDIDAKTPPPKHPVPWEEKKIKSKNEKLDIDSKNTKKLKMKKKEKPLKQLYKILRP